jgi:hypothetical protein
VQSLPRRLVLAAVVALAAAAPAAGVRSPQTTGPGPFALVRVTLTATNAKVARRTVFRGTKVEFFIVNDGKKPRNFVVGTEKSRLLKAGERQRLFHTFRLRGRYTWTSRSPGGPTVRGTFDAT